MRNNNPELEIDLSGADLSATNLPRVDLSNVNLVGIKLIESYMFGADLTGANLLEADLLNANLTLAELSGAELSRANMSKANLRGANLIEANLNLANLSLANLESTDLTNCNLFHADLTGANLFKSNLISAINREHIKSRTSKTDNEVLPIEENDQAGNLRHSTVMTFGKPVFVPITKVSDSYENPVLKINIVPGSAPPEEIGELLAEISILYRMIGGEGIVFTPSQVDTLEVVHHVQ